MKCLSLSFIKKVKVQIHKVREVLIKVFIMQEVEDQYCAPITTSFTQYLSYIK